jgi:soluble lytic murein transglycosylase
MALDARREWYHTTKTMNKRELQLAAILAHKWGWHDRAIMTLSKTGHTTDLDVRFPIAYRKQVMKNAKRQKIEPAWILGILRQESAFRKDARSHAGALGLMQLMPRTGRMEARLIKSPLRHIRDLLNVDKNILLGSSHLSRLLNKNNGNHVLATASYNAGPNHVKKWLRTKDGQQMPADLWVETIPFKETRRYVRKVMTGTAIFEHKLENKVTPLQKRMSAIKTVAWK